jgi:hypothetical protein
VIKEETDEEVSHVLQALQGGPSRCAFIIMSVNGGDDTGMIAERSVGGVVTTDF